MTARSRREQYTTVTLMPRDKALMDRVTRGITSGGESRADALRHTFKLLDQLADASSASPDYCRLFARLIHPLEVDSHLLQILPDRLSTMRGRLERQADLLGIDPDHFLRTIEAMSLPERHAFHARTLRVLSDDAATDDE